MRLSLSFGIGRLLYKVGTAVKDKNVLFAKGDRSHALPPPSIGRGGFYIKVG
jgi:hypothetical protein